MKVMPPQDRAVGDIGVDRGTIIVEFISEFAAAHGYSPSIREIGQAVGLSSSSSVHHHLLKLEKGGRIARTQNRARAVVVPEPRAAA